MGAGRRFIGVEDCEAQVQLPAGRLRLTERFLGALGGTPMYVGGLCM